MNTDFSSKGLSAQEIQAVVAAWQASAIGRETMLDLFRRCEVLPEGRTNEEEEQLIAQDNRVPPSGDPQNQRPDVQLNRDGAG